MEKTVYLETLIEGLIHPIIVLQKDLKIYRINDEAKKIFGIKQAENITFGQLIKCKNAHVGNDCQLEPFCKKCDFVNIIDSLNENNNLIKDQTAIIYKTEKEENTSCQITFSAKLLAQFNDLILVTIHSINQEIIKTKNKSEINLAALENAPFEFFYLNNQGEIIYSNTLARKNLNTNLYLNKATNIVNINQNASDTWWQKHLEELQKSKTISFETSHTNREGISYPVIVNMSLINHDGEDRICYYCFDISDQHLAQETLLKESMINQSLAEISRELSIHNSLNSIILLVRQYALAITESLFCFIVYEDPITNKSVVSVYSDASETYKNEAFIIESSLKQHYNKLLLDKKLIRSEYSDIYNNNDNTIPDEFSFMKLLPFNRAAWTGIFFHEEYKGLLFVAGKNEEYDLKDIDNLINLGNLFGIAVNRSQERVKLLNNMEQLELALDVADMGVWNIYPLENKITIDKSRSGKIFKSLGSLSEYSLLDYKHLIHPNDLPKALEAFFEHMDSNSSFFQCILRILNKKKEYIWFEINGRVVSRNNLGEVTRIVGVIIDIHNTMKLNEELVKSKEEAVLANKAKSAFIARISHELRTPLNAIVGFSDYLISQITNPVYQDYLLNIKSSGTKLVNMVNEVLDFAKLESGMLSINAKPVNLRAIIVEIQRMFSILAHQKELDFIIEISNKLPEFLVLDESQIRQILNNLIGNAIKFTEKGYIKVIIDIQNITTSEVDLIVEVIDTGIGIRPDFQSKIFDDFTQQEDQDNRRYGGTGLGLGIVKKLVTLIGGEITLNSAPGEGSTFKVILPKREFETLNVKNDSNNHNNFETIVHTAKRSKHIGVDCKSACKDFVKEWNLFASRPSFKSIPPISEKIKAIAIKYNDETLGALHKRMERCLETFDVEELNEIIKEFEKYTLINQ